MYASAFGRLAWTESGFYTFLFSVSGLSTILKGLISYSFDKKADYDMNSTDFLLYLLLNKIFAWKIINHKAACLFYLQGFLFRFNFHYLSLATRCL